MIKTLLIAVASSFATFVGINVHDGYTRVDRVMECVERAVEVRPNYNLDRLKKACSKVTK